MIGGAPPVVAAPDAAPDVILIRPSAKWPWRYFGYSELRCPCCDTCYMSPAFVSRLDRLRMEFGEPLTVNSAYRCVMHNRSVGGKPHSRHLHGDAADLSLGGMTASQRWRLLSLACAHGFGGIGLHCKGPGERRLLHVDARECGGAPRAVWTY